MSRGTWKRKEPDELAADIAARMAEPEPPAEGIVYGVGPLPSDADKVEDVIDRSVKRMLSQTMDPKDLAKAVEAATKWVSVKYKITEDSEYGSKLTGGVAHAG